MSIETKLQATIVGGGIGDYPGISISMTKQEIMENMCFIKGQPIIDKSGFGRHRIICNPIDEDWKRRIKEMWWSTEYQGNLLDRELEDYAMHMRDCLILRNRLITAAGEEACMPYFEPDYVDIMQYGQFFFGGSHVRMCRGYACACHSNSARYYEDHKCDNLRITTGYALSKDGMWRQHAWLVERGEDDYTIIETTEKRVLYFGFCLDDEQSDVFCDKNW